MLVIISLVAIAIVIIAVLMMFNMNAVTNEKTLKHGSQNKGLEPSKEEVEPSLPTANPVETKGQEKIIINELEQPKTSSISDQAYRQALQSFSKADQEDSDINSKEKMNDDVFRKALQSMSNKAENFNG
ncbi:hypothetical protein SAMN05444673_7142 [Bacillus sp. OV166]|uniref:hypothetical protein n=1 Tax=Bacillus sp. OV166 TaxID=1882763 RepID=UPI000A2AA67F|nr:hypothetical protein [Bacillus sp. OV166]SMQ87042.1 hypothetical protein SAMN05444673_7142 [Bacillus sp. OV166]